MGGAQGGAGRVALQTAPAPGASTVVAPWAFDLTPVRTGLALLVVSSVSAFAADMTAGETAYGKCRPCHAVGEGAVNRVGPQLNGTVGRRIASVAAFKGYGETLKRMGGEGLIWTTDRLEAYLADPKAFASGTRMAFDGIRDETERADLVRFLRRFDPDGVEQ